MQKDQKKIRVAIYTRVSTEYQIERDSLPYQKNSLEMYAMHVLNADSYEVFTDAGFTGTNIRRPAYLQMLQKIRNGKFTHLLVWRIDRISRNLIDFCELYEELNKYHIAFISQTEQFDTTSVIGGAMLRIIMIFAQLESEITAERIHTVLTSKAIDGEWTGGHPPYGYRYDTETKEITTNEMEAQVVRYIFRCYEILRSCRAVAELLNAQYLKTANGNHWSAQAIEDVLKNSFYIGVLSYNKRPKSRETDLNEPLLITVEEHHRPLVDSKLFKVCSGLLSLQSNQSKTRTRKQTHCHILSGLLFCAKCGQPLLSQEGSTQKSGWKYSTYVCSGRRKKNCMNPYTSDLHLLPPLFFFLLRVLQVQADFDSNWNLCDFQAQLFDHPALQGLKLTKKSRTDLYEYVKQGVFSNLGLLPFQSEVYRNILDIETEKYKTESELSTMTKALAKLEKLYHHPKSTISEAEYSTEREQIIREKERLNQRLSVLISSPQNSSGMKTDIAIFRESMNSSAHLTSSEIFSKVNPLLLQEFMNRLLLQVDVNDNKVTALYFKNGLVQEFENDNP